MCGGLRYLGYCGLLYRRHFHRRGVVSIGVELRVPTRRNIRERTPKQTISGNRNFEMRGPIGITAHLGRQRPIRKTFVSMPLPCLLGLLVGCLVGWLSAWLVAWAAWLLGFLAPRLLGS